MVLTGRISGALLSNKTGAGSPLPRGVVVSVLNETKGMLV
jgi:hypothetical protein